MKALYRQSVRTPEYGARALLSFSAFPLVFPAEKRIFVKSIHAKTTRWSKVRMCFTSSLPGRRTGRQPTAASATMPTCITLNIVPTWTRRFPVSCKGKVQICLRPGMHTGKNLVCERMLKKKRMPENRKEISFFV